MSGFQKDVKIELDPGPQPSGDPGELPPLDVTDEDRAFADLWESAHVDKTDEVAMRGCRERQLRESLAQIATLAAQVKRDAADASWARTNRPKLADCEDALRKAEAELATAKSDLDMEVARLLKAQDLQIEATTQARNEASSESLWRKQAERERDALKAELAALREGETVAYRVDRYSAGLQDFTFHEECADMEVATDVARHLRDDAKQQPRIVEIITRERILEPAPTT